MKQQIIIIHGGDSFEKYEDYLENLHTKDVSLEKLRSVGWKRNLGHDLGKGYEVLLPLMPNASNARYSEWKIWFERLIPLFEEKVIFIGHSLGAIFLIKYLSENIYPKKIKAVLLVGAPYNTPTIHPLADFVITSPLDNLIKQSGKITLFHSKDDEVVPFENAKRYKKDIPELDLQVFEDRGHFNDETFPEIVQACKKI